LPSKKHHFREEAINVLLANTLAGRGLDANPETIEVGGRPDILILLEGLKLVLEGRTTQDRDSLLQDARERVELGIADISIAIFYPKGLAVAATINQLKESIESARYDGSLFFFDRNGLTSTSFEGDSIDELVQTINSTFRLRIQNDVVREQVAQLEQTIENVVDDASSTNLFFSSEVLVGKLKHALGIGGDEKDDAERD
jgi:hypothetical protein